jgi:hypothetical protein
VYLDVLQVGVFEVSGIFETEAKESIEANVGGPNQNKRKKLWFGVRKPTASKTTGVKSVCAKL